MAQHAHTPLPWNGLQHFAVNGTRFPVNGNGTIMRTLRQTPFSRGPSFGGRGFGGLLRLGKLRRAWSAAHLTAVRAADSPPTKLLPPEYSRWPV